MHVHASQQRLHALEGGLNCKVQAREKPQALKGQLFNLEYGIQHHAQLLVG